MGAREREESAENKMREHQQGPKRGVGVGKKAGGGGGEQQRVEKEKTDWVSE